MTITNGYATLSEFQTRTGLTADQLTNKTTLIEREIERNSRMIDRLTSNIFYTKTLTNSKVRFTWGVNPDGLYMTEDRKRIYCRGNFISLTSVVDDGVTLVADTDYILGTNFIESVNHFTASLTNGVVLTGSCGYSATPDEINEICLAMSEVTTGLGTYTMIDSSGSRIEVTRDNLPDWVSDRLALFVNYATAG